ncbi:hypothetical protein LSUE1_G005617 [Lachnellula suecica]|uniref:Uncharacterized protein n=1 Tax=Lachnellula suecica TaxID=602035 RepID=A0A8T9C0S1_9HELO|nr:hypothetical protein LSUE1_G005617 [Lachnellula suecica]
MKLFSQPTKYLLLETDEANSSECFAITKSADHGSFGLESPYKGPPSPAVEAAWGDITRIGPMSISKETLEKINASIYSVGVPELLGGGFLALPEFAHQIHCVEMMWHATYPDYFQEQHNYSVEHSRDWHQHIDHCADLLVQKLKCDADVGLATYSWVKHHYMPHPNFNVQHKCRNFDDVLAWAKENALDSSPLGHPYFTKPASSEYVEFTEPPFHPQSSE